LNALCGVVESVMRTRDGEEFAGGTERDDLDAGGSQIDAEAEFLRHSADAANCESTRPPWLWESMRMETAKVSPRTYEITYSAGVWSCR
jgi:hypothetical protein